MRSSRGPSTGSKPNHLRSGGSAKAIKRRAREPERRAPHSPKGWVWDIKKYAIHDGPGIRTTVFLKGCPLRCGWCCNPEGQHCGPTLLYLKEKCTHCNRCLEVCPNRAIEEGFLGTRQVRRGRCNLCGLCAEQCPNQALKMVGRYVSADEILREVIRDAVFYERSGGGLTLTGGEPTSQPEFAYEILRQYKIQERGGHTAIETCGFVDWSILSHILKHTDLVLYDLKHMDPKIHLRSTGVDNKRILQNAQLIAKSSVRLVIRFPLIPGFNDSMENIQKTASFVRALPNVNELDILPYHRLGEPKYERLGQHPRFSSLSTLSPTRLTRIRSFIESFGFRVRIGG
jgi:pyruvate formate lyase activating enzyme